MKITQMEIDLNKFQSNISKIKEYVGEKSIMPVIKANGYGTYINTCASILNQFNIVAVARSSEAIDLRTYGYERDIFILNQPYIDDIDEIERSNSIVGISSKEFLEQVISNNASFRVHIEIETGMNRTGVKLEELDEFIHLLELSNLKVEGVYTHLSSADFDDNYTEKQFEIFREAVDILKNFFDLKYIHTSASNGLLKFDDGISNLVRPGIIIYGYDSYEGACQKLDLEPIAKLKTKVTFLKDVKIGEAISYSQKYVAPKDMKVATIPIGYADGLRRDLTNQGEVYINGNKCKIIGTVCMDGCMVDVSNVDNIKVGDDVYIWDNDNITLDEIAKQCNTINYEIISGISTRVNRVFKED